MRTATVGDSKHGRQLIDGLGSNGLYLHVTPGGAKCWVQRLMVPNAAIGKRPRVRIGLGAWPRVTLAQARRAAFANRCLRDEGRDLLAAKRRRAHEAAKEARVPEAARAVVVSLDGVMAPMRDAGGYREAGCATVSLVDGDGEQLASVRMGRMPQVHKATLKTIVAAEVEAVLAQRPNLTVVKVADGAKDNWTFLTGTLPEGVELIDFYHAVEHLKDAFDTAHGADSPTAAAQFKKYRHRLRHEPDGVARVIRALVYLRSKSPGNERIAQVNCTGFTGRFMT